MKHKLSTQALTLAAVGVVLFLVSVPRVHQFALQDNERDAKSSLLTLFSTVYADEGDRASRQIPAPEAWDQEVKCRLYDAHTSEGSALLQRHGYLLELAHRPDGSDFLRAWPTKHGATGRSAFLLDSERGLIEHENIDGAWSGPSSSRPDGTEPGWQSESPTR
jgi:hypothetical protein